MERDVREHACPVPARVSQLGGPVDCRQERGRRVVDHRGRQTLTCQQRIGRKSTGRVERSVVGSGVPLAPKRSKEERR